MILCDREVDQMQDERRLFIDPRPGPDDMDCFLLACALTFGCSNSS